MRGEVHGVDEDPRAGGVGRSRDGGHVRDRPEEVRRAGDRDPAGAVGETIGDRVDRQAAARHVELGEDDASAPVGGRHDPRRDVGVVVEPGADDLVAGAEVARDGAGERERERRHVGAEHDPRAAGAQQLGDRLPRPLHEPAGAHARSERTTDVGAVAVGEVGAHRFDGHVHHQRARRPVETGDAAPNAGEPRAELGGRDRCHPGSLADEGEGSGT
jgi:hypothetical protein